MKLYHILLYISLFLFFSCKKKETTVEEPAAQTTTGGSSTPTSYNGFLQSTAYAVWTGSTSSLGPYHTVNVYLLSSPSPTVSFFLGINSGTLNLNFTKLKYAAGRYYDTTYVLDLSSQKNFQLQSNGSFPSFSYNNVDSFPKFYFNYNNLINDTLSKTGSYTVPVSGFSYANEIKCSLQDLSNFTAFVTKTVSNGTGQVVFTPAELAVFITGSNISLSVELKKYNSQTISGKNFRFESNTFSSFNVHVNP